MSSFALFPIVLVTALTTAPKVPTPEPPPLPNIALTVLAPDAAGPWKLIAENRSREPVRLAADGRLLTLEIEPEGANTGADGRALAGAAKRPAQPPKPLQCRLPADLRPSGVVDDRALVLRPGERYEEVFSPALFCFEPRLAGALVPGARLTAHLGFSPPIARGKKPPVLRPPFVAEPTEPTTAYGPVKELISSTFTVPATPAPAAAFSAPAPGESEPRDAGAPRIALLVPARVDAANERTVGMSLRVKNTGGRPTLLHVRRDNFSFRVDGPSESADCGVPSDARTVARDQFTELAPQRSLGVDIWVGEMCSDVVFDRPGLYRIGVALAFPSTSGPTSIKPWTDAVSASEPVLVRVRAGRLPFYGSPPEALGH